MSRNSPHSNKKSTKVSKKNASPKTLALIQAIKTEDVSTMKKMVSELPIASLCESFAYKCPKKTVNNNYFNMKVNIPMMITPLGYAILCGKYSIVRDFVDTKPGVLRCRLPTNVYSPLELSVMFGRSDISYYLLYKNVPIGDALHDAVAINDMNHVKLMISAGANVCKRSGLSSETPLEMATSFDMVKILVDAGANVNTRNKTYIVGGTPLMSFLWFGEDCKGVKYLIDKGTSMKQKGTYKGVSGINALHALAMTKKVFTPDGKKSLQILCEAFAKERISLNQKTSENKTALTYIFEQIFQQKNTSMYHKQYHLDVILCFMKLGADIKQVKLSGNRKTTPLDDLVFKFTQSPTYNDKICKLFNGDYPIKLTDTAFPFHIITKLTTYCHGSSFGTTKRVKDTVDYLIRQGFDINACISTSGNTALKNVYGYIPVFDIPPIRMVEKYLAGKNRRTSGCAKRLGDLQSIFMSRGAVSKTGRSSGPARKKRKDYITNWTTGIYRNIQNSRRKSSSPKNPGVERINRYLAQTMRNTALRVPTVPRGYENINNLYRGIHGPIAKKLLENGEFRDKGYIAFSRDPAVSNLFGANVDNGGITLKIPVRTIPKGTPWIWFRNKNSGNVINKTSKNRNIHTSNEDEKEVLLPPGTIRLVDKNAASKGKTLNLEAIYIPNANATSIRGSRMRRKQ